MDDARDNESNEQKPEQQAGGGIDRRKFLGALGAAAAAGAFLGRGGPLKAQDAVYWFYDSFGNVVPAAADAIAAGILPPPLPEGVSAGSFSPLTSCDETYVTGGYAQPNILVIMVDQMRLPRWLTPSQRSTLFSNIMPNVYGSGSSSLAYNAVNLPNYFVADTACTPSRATFLTGLYAQQTCIFQTQSLGATPPSLQPYNNGAGFATIGDVLRQRLPINCDGGVNSLPYDTAWIGKWHVSDLAFGTGADPTGANGPLDYGFTSQFCIPTNAYSTPYHNAYPSPNGMENESTGGDNLIGGLPQFTYNTAAGDPGDVNAHTLNIHPRTGYLQLSDAAIYHAFHSYWLNTAPSPWFLALSFVGPHDIQSFPWAFGLSSNLNGQACGPSNDFACSSHGPTVGFYPPPVLGWTDNYDSANIVSFNGLPSLYNASSAPPNGWNNTESPESNLYGSAGGKPVMQAYFQSQVDAQAGHIYTANGWNTFLNYYYWLHGSVDTLIGLVLNDIRGIYKSGHSKEPVIIFTSDHGDYAGSHSMHAKAGALYDESLNVPLLIHMKNQVNATSRNFLCSSVDMLPFIYTLALGNESWRSNPNDMVSYLNNRESIFDSIMYGNADSRRLAPYTNQGGFGHTGSPLPYVLHTTDEYPEAAYPAGDPVPSHAIAFRTLDKTVVYQDGNTGMNFFGGGKLGMYTAWLNCTTYPDAARTDARAPQFEFYDYYPPGNNYGEMGNDAFNSGWAWNAATAGVYLNSYNNIMGQELYRIDPKFQNAFNTAFNAYMNFLGSTQGGGPSCTGIEVGPPNTIPPP